MGLIKITQVDNKRAMGGFSNPPASCSCHPLSVLLGGLDHPFEPQTRSRAVRLEIGLITHDGLGLCLSGSQTVYHPGENPHGIPALPAVVSVLWGPYSQSAPRQRKPLRFKKMILLSTQQSSTRGLP